MTTRDDKITLEEIAMRPAHHVLLDQAFFDLDDSDWDTFWATIEASPVPNAALVALMAETPPWHDCANQPEEETNRLRKEAKDKR